LKDKFARWAIRSEKTEGHDLRSEEGRKSMEEDLIGEVLRILKTSPGVTSGREYRVEPTSGESGKTKDGGSLQRRELIADLRLRILEVKKCEKELQSSRFSASVLLLSLDDE
jgi:hypothetical protein